MKSKLYFIEIDDLNNFAKYNKLTAYLSLEKQKQINNFRFDIDKKLSLLSDLFVRYIVCKILRLSNRDIMFTKNAYGKPYLIGYPDFQYNISHTRNAIAIGVSSTEVGVDIEKMKMADINIAERFFSKEELDYILSGNKHREMLFYEIWTQKEAYIKWVGKGLSMPLTGFDVTSIDIRSRMKIYRINDYIISLCCNECNDNIDLIELNENQLFRIISEFIAHQK